MIKKINRILFIVITVAIVTYFSGLYYHKIFANNVIETDLQKRYLLIKTGSTLEDVMAELRKNNFLIDYESFEWIAELRNYSSHIHPGRYLIEKGMSNYNIINLIRSGKQIPVRLTFNNLRTKYQLASIISRQIEADSLSIIMLFSNSDYLSDIGFDTSNIACLFIPNTYEFYWDTNADQLLKRMFKEYSKFWNEERNRKAREINLSPVQVSVLASLIQAEQGLHKEEWPIIAGLYINRLKNNIILQSDPTLVFAIGDFTIQRVLDEYKEIESPYNTYKYAGLPPGPINIPEKETIDAVLNYDKNDYFYMCAKDDFSGFHYFSKTQEQHSVYAQKYRRALNKRNIMK
jgi:UPF0755 protein